MTRMLLFLLVVFGLLVPAYGQGMTYGRGVVLPRQPIVGQNNRGPKGPKLDKFEADGTVAGVARGKIMLKTVTNQKWVIHCTPQTTLLVQGKAESDFLRPGLCVQFNVEINKQGHAQEKITYLVITTPTLTNPLGCRPEAAMGMALAGPPGAAAGLGVGPPPAGNPRAKPPASQRYTVHGQISKLTNGKITVVAPGGAKVEAELDENVQIDVAMADISVAKVGDRITVKGGMPKGMGAMRPGAIGNAQAKEVTIELQNPLTGPRKKPIRKPPAEKPERKGKPEPKDGAKPAPKPPPKGPARPARKPVVPVEDEEPFKAPKKK